MKIKTVNLLGDQTIPIIDVPYIHNQILYLIMPLIQTNYNEIWSQEWASITAAL